MTSRDFCFWLQGFFELGSAVEGPLSIEQKYTIKNHLALVFKHEIDPSTSPDPNVQADLNKTHNEKIEKVGPKNGQVYRC